MVAVLAIVGLLAVAGGLAMIWPPLAMIAVGLFLLLAARGYAMTQKRPAGE